MSGKNTEDKNSAYENRGHLAREKTDYGRLYRKFIMLTLVCSLIPLLAVGWAINLHYTRFSKSRMIQSFRTQVDDHRRVIELFLRERCANLQLIAQTHEKSYLEQTSNLAQVFETMNVSNGYISDLGVIDDQGRHLAYVGPYDLIDKNYFNELWFKRVMEKGLFISDMFMGFRKV
ncbi:MAG: two-component sensor histidine kinase, partial [Deltaproteobacteria bacterium]|nr:two-component sensor histidine kinase [Deltaproteobacteria bacterium]